MVRSLRSLRGQLAAAIILVLALGLGILLLMTGTQIAHMTMESFTHEQQVTALVLANSLSESLERSQAQQMMVLWTTHRNQWRRELPEDTNLSVFDIHGSLLASSGTADEAHLAANLATVLGGDVVSSTAGGRLYTAVAVRHEGHGILGVAQLDSSLGPVQAQLSERWLALIGVTGATLLLALVIALWLAGQLTRPLLELRQVAQQMAEGRLGARVEIDNSVNELASLGTMFNHMADQVEGTIQQQREFVANASHELRAPLAAMKLRAEALVDQTVSGERARQYAGEISEEVSQLATLVGDLLQLSRAESGTFMPPDQPIALADELAVCARIVRPQAIAKRQSLDLQVAEDMPDLYIHPSDLRMMVGNLLDNAIKYTPEGGTISLSARWQIDRLEIVVSDTGPGIAPVDLPRVGERFFRVDRAHTRSTPGMGLGLALTTAIARQYKGALRITSNGIPGQGTQAALTIEDAHKVHRDISLQLS